MYVVGEEFAYIATPRTASRAVSEALTKHCGAKLVSPHHVDFQFLFHVKQNYPDLKLYTFTREPISHLLSWYRLLKSKVNNPTVDVELRRKFLQGVSDGLDFLQHELVNQPFEIGFPQMLLHKATPFKKQRKITGYSLNPYAPYADKVFVYEHGLQQFFDHLGLNIVPETVGKLRDDKQQYALSETLLAQTKAIYASDFELYESICHSNTSNLTTSNVLKPEQIISVPVS